MNIRLTVILTILAMVVNATVIISKPIDGVTFNKAGDEHVLTLNIELPSCPQITAGPTDKDFAINFYKVKPAYYSLAKDWLTADDRLNDALCHNIDNVYNHEILIVVESKEEKPEKGDTSKNGYCQESSQPPTIVSAVLSVFDFMKPLKHKTTIVTIGFLFIALFLKLFNFSKF